VRIKPERERDQKKKMASQKRRRRRRVVVAAREFICLSLGSESGVTSRISVVVVAATVCVL
jgi:hypothetical protein